MAWWRAVEMGKWWDGEMRKWPGGGMAHHLPTQLSWEIGKLCGTSLFATDRSKDSYERTFTSSGGIILCHISSASPALF